MNKPLTECSGLIWINGEFVEWQEANVHILSHTLHYGCGVFEGERAYNGQIFMKTQHHQRLHNSAAMLGFAVPYTVAELDRIADEILQRNQMDNAYLRPIVWYGAEGLSVASTKNSINIAIAAWEWHSYFAPGTAGIKLMWSDWIRPAPTMAPVHAKANGLYLTGTMSKNKAEQQGYHDALMLDYRGYVAECTAANIFMVKDGVLYTPIADCFLNGITRQTVIKLANSCHIPCVEKHITPTEILTAEEIFVTGTAIEILPVIQIGETSFNIGKVTRQIMAEFTKLVKGQLGE